MENHSNPADAGRPVAAPVTGVTITLANGLMAGSVMLDFDDVCAVISDGLVTHFKIEGDVLIAVAHVVMVQRGLPGRVELPAGLPPRGLPAT